MFPPPQNSNSDVYPPYPFPTLQDQTLSPEAEASSSITLLSPPHFSPPLLLFSAFLNQLLECKVRQRGRGTDQMYNLQFVSSSMAHHALHLQEAIDFMENARDMPAPLPPLQAQQTKIHIKKEHSRSRASQRFHSL